jgi:GDP/UDP-N,N'-diacetylbacillosamine 2-epimerase (hydrolysing)
LGIDNLKRLSLLGLSELEAALNFTFGRRNLLITFHPATLESTPSSRQLSEVLEALEMLDDTHLIFTKPNADRDSRVLAEMIDDFVARHRTACAFTSLGQLRYLSCVRHVDGVVGNSSSGLAEVPSFGKGTINIGDRQRGRLKAASVIDCRPERQSVVAALERLYSPAFQAILDSVRNPYGEGGASDRVVAVLRDYPLESIVKKHFHDLVHSRPTHG